MIDRTIVTGSWRDESQASVRLWQALYVCEYPCGCVRGLFRPQIYRKNGGFREGSVGSAAGIFVHASRGAVRPKGVGWRKSYRRMRGRGNEEHSSTSADTCFPPAVRRVFELPSFMSITRNRLANSYYDGRAGCATGIEGSSMQRERAPAQRLLYPTFPQTFKAGLGFCMEVVGLKIRS